MHKNKKLYIKLKNLNLYINGAIIFLYNIRIYYDTT